jgi:hypothetical protein
MKKHLTDGAVKAAKFSKGKSRSEVNDTLCICAGLVLRRGPASKT